MNKFFNFIFWPALAGLVFAATLLLTPRLTILLPGLAVGYQLRQSGNMLVEREPQPHIPLEIELRRMMQILMIQPLGQLGVTSRMLLDFTICMAMYGSGVRIGTGPTQRAP